MDVVPILTICVVVCALLFDVINGFHDTANAVATAISTKALKVPHAILLAGSMNFLGALTFTGVAKTLTKDIIDPFTLPNSSVVILAALLAAIAWNLITWYFGIPSSSSHAIIGAIAGSAIAAVGYKSLNYTGLIKIIEALILSPIIAFVFGYIVFSLFTVIFKNRNLLRVNKRFRKFQIFTAALQSFSHGTNDAQKTMGIITMTLISNGQLASNDIPFWVQLSCATAMAIGTSIGGWRIITTVGGKITKIRPVDGVAADLNSAIIIFGATLIHLPVSTTHVISSSIMGVGASRRLKGVQWNTAKNMIITWVTTLPLSAALSGLIYLLLDLVI